MKRFLLVSLILMLGPWQEGRLLAVDELPPAPVIKKKPSKQRIMKKRSSKMQVKKKVRKNRRMKSKRRASDVAKKKCEKVRNAYLIPWTRFAYLGGNRYPIPTCVSKQSRKKVSQMVKPLLLERRRAVVAVLPKSSDKRVFAQMIMEGFQVGLGERITWYWIDGDQPNWMQELAQSVTKIKPRLVLSGLLATKSKQIAAWADKLSIPHLVIDADMTASGKQVFQVFPDERRLAFSLVDKLYERGVRRVAIMKPTSGKSNRVVEYFRQRMQERQMDIAVDVDYDFANFDHFDLAVRQALQLEIEHRRDEYYRAYNRAKRKSRRAGVKFNPRMVNLKPIVQFDALFIPDDFRVARHTVRLLKYYGVEKMQLVGHHEWRSPALVYPYDELLEGALFVDYVGPYSELPKAVVGSHSSDGMFVPTENVLNVDLRTLGYRIGSLVARTMDIKEKPYRLYRSLRQASLAGIGAMDVKTFGTNQLNRWPVHFYTVRDKKIVPLAR